MKDTTPETRLSEGSDRFVESVLEEHARLGADPLDHSLIQRILVETTDRGSTASSAQALQTSHWKGLAIGLSAAAATFVAGVFFLQSFQVGGEQTKGKEVHFVVEILDQESETGPVSDETPPAVAVRRSSRPIEPTFAKIDALVSPEGADADYFVGNRFGPSIPDLPEKFHRHNRFLISAQDVTVQNDHTQFSGDVVIAHEIWRIEADSASVPNSGTVGRDDVAPGDSFQAFEVTVTQGSPSRTVSAEQLSFDAVNGSLVLTGVRSLSTSEGILTDLAREDRLILTARSLSIENVAEVKYASPALKTPEK